MNYKIKKSYYRLFSVLLSLVMIVISVPFSATAQESTENETDLIASIGGPYGQDHTETPTQKSPEVLAADAEAMRREQLIQNGIDPDQPLSNNSTAQLVQGGEELQPLADYPQVLSGGEGVYAIKHLRGNYFIKTEHPEWLAGYHMQQQYTSSSTIMNNFSTGYLFKLTQHPQTGSYIIRLMYNNALSFAITPKADGSGYEVLTKDIQLDDALVPLSDTYVISASGSGFKIRKYGTTNCIAVNGTQTNLTATTEIGDSIRWTFTQYTGAERNSAVMLYSSTPTVGQTTTLIPVIYSTRPGYNMPHLDMSQIPEESYHISGPNEYGRFSLTPHDGPDWTFHIYVKNASSPSSSLVYASKQDFKIKLPIDEGIYYFENAELSYMYMQIDDNASISEDGAIMELWTLSGNDNQRWVLDHLSDGYYKITSVASGKALTMTTETDGSVTQTDYTENFNQLWLISENSNGTYSLRSYVFYLAAGDGYLTPAGRNVEGRDAQSDAKDEWDLIPMYAYSVGGEFYNGNDVIDASETWAECGHNSSYTINPLLSNLSESNLNSEIVYFSSHGSQHALSLLNDVHLTDGLIAATNNTVEISDMSLPKARLYVYDACLTASNEDGSGRNLCTETISAGADCVIGWTESIYSVDARDWQIRFQSKLVSGSSVISAANYANTFFYGENNLIKSWRIYGNQELIVNEQVVSNDNTDDSDNLLLVSIAYPQHSDATIKAILDSSFTTFSNETATITITYTNSDQTNYVIDYCYLVNGFSTSSGYSIIVENGIITQMRDNTIASNSSARTRATTSVPIITQEIIEAAIEQAVEMIESMDNNYIVVEHSGNGYYDIETNTYYYRVMTTYMTPQNTYGAVMTFYEL